MTLALWPVAALLLSVTFGATSIRLIEDDPIVQKIKDIISSANDYVTDHMLADIKLPDLKMPLNPLILTEGKLGQFNTIQLVGDPTINQRTNSDGTTTYSYDLDLDLNVILLEYQFHISLFGPFSQDGQVIISPQRNVLKAKGFVVIGPNHCDASMNSADVTSFEDFQIDVEPDDIPFATKISEIILNFVSPRLLPMTNTAIKAILLVPSFQNTFSDFVCKNMNATQF